MNRRNLGWAAILLILPLLAGCSDDDNTTIMAPEAGVAIARVAHLSPDAPPVDVWVDGEVALSNVAFRGVSPYLELAEGEYRVQVTPTGRSTPVVIDEMLTLAGETAYTVAAQGLLTGISANVLVDDRVPSASSAEVRFVHTSPDAPPVDVTLTDGT
ncbi:MAG TPA: DUF4397 domain-containing protein, partial [bacterium]|nr:DUF4397 domain-containing protein [bacterium]